MIFICDFIHLVFKCQLAIVHIVHVVQGRFLVDILWYLMAIILLFETWHLSCDMAHNTIVAHVALHGRVVVDIGFGDLSDGHLLLILVKSHLLIHSVFDLSSLLDLNDTWPVSWIDQSNLIISINLIQLANLDQIIDDLATVGPSEYLLTSSTLSLFDILIPTLDSTFISLINSLLSNGPDIDILVKDVQLAD